MEWGLGVYLADLSIRYQGRIFRYSGLYSTTATRDSTETNASSNIPHGHEFAADKILIRIVD